MIGPDEVRHAGVDLRHGRAGCRRVSWRQARAAGRDELDVIVNVG